MVASDILKELNDQQREVALTTEGAVLVLAGAGTGKTRSVIYRAGYLVASGKVRLNNLLIVTFTNKAAGEMKERVEKLLSGFDFFDGKIFFWQNLNGTDSPSGIYVYDLQTESKNIFFDTGDRYCNSDWLQHTGNQLAEWQRETRATHLPP